MTSVGTSLPKYVRFNSRMESSSKSVSEISPSLSPALWKTSETACCSQAFDAPARDSPETCISTNSVHPPKTDVRRRRVPFAR